MAVLAYDDVWVREPRLMMPRMQPIGPVKIDFSHPMAHNLVYYNQLYNPVSRSMNLNSPDVYSGVPGRSFLNRLWFGAHSTFGAGTTDKVTTTFSNWPAVFTFAITVYQNGSGEGGLGRILEKEANSFRLYNNNPVIRFEVNFSSTLGRWTWNRPLNKVYRFVISFDTTSAANDPVFYSDGVPQSVTEVSSPAGSWSFGNTVVTFANRSAGDRGFDGLLADAMIWNKILTPQQVMEDYLNTHQFLIPA